jgi:hypothetical protein
MNDKVLATHRPEELRAHQARDDNRAILVFGEASPAAVTELGAIAKQVVGTAHVKVLTAFAASEVVARGAASYSRWAQDLPSTWGLTQCGFRDD